MADLFFDDFTGTTGTLLSAHTPDVGPGYGDVSEGPAAHYELNGTGGARAVYTAPFNQNAWFLTNTITGTFDELTVEFVLRLTSGSGSLNQTTDGAVWGIYMTMGGAALNVLLQGAGNEIDVFSSGTGWYDTITVGEQGAGGAPVTFRIDWLLGHAVVSINGVVAATYDTGNSESPGDIAGDGDIELDLAYGNTLESFRVTEYTSTPEPEPSGVPFWTAIVDSREIA